MEHYTYESSLPAGYTCAFHIDASNRKTGLIMTLVALGIAILLIAGVFFWAGSFSFDDPDAVLLYDLVFLLGIVAYVFLHELTHGAVYKILTRQRLRFGITWSAAFCGVPDIYVYRRTALLALAAPLTVFTVILLPLTIIFHSISTGWYFVFGLLFSLHLSGCVGDIYMMWLLLRRYRDPRTLMRDTGPEQWVYVVE